MGEEPRSARDRGENVTQAASVRGKFEAPLLLPSLCFERCTVTASV